MSDFSPVDHKESDSEYVASVRTAVAEQTGVELLPIEDPAGLIGLWRSCPRLSSYEGKIEHLGDGTLKMSSDAKDAKPGRWRLKEDAYIQTTWVPPMPEYGIDEESWNEEAYRCARTSDGRIVYWNGDGSLIVTLSPIKA
jgi:hypothetical protein